jgi:gluconokinase
MEAGRRGENVVLACSALKHAYQYHLAQFLPEPVRYVYLDGSEELIRRRLARRPGHFMDPDLLDSQFDTLEPPEGAVRVDISPSPAAIAAAIRLKLGL